MAEELPIKPKPQKCIPLYRAPLILEREGSLLVRKTPEGEIMQGLHQFPYFDTSPKGPTASCIAEKLKAWKIQAEHFQTLEEVQHGFTRYRVRLFPTLVRVREAALEGYFWASPEALDKIAFSSGDRKILKSLRYL